MKKRIISLVLALSMLLSFFTITAHAANDEEFISDVALIYEDSVKDVKIAIAGTDWKLWEQDLNPKADLWFDDGVYLIYKTSTNVEDAITDLRVMDMYGGYSTSNYKNQLEASRQAYLKAVGYIRTAAAEFAARYAAGDEMAKIAYRQMNYYKDIGESGMLMGDFMLNIPSDDALVTVMMEGNSFVVTNLVALLAVGLSGNGTESLATRIAAMYEIKDTLTDVDYYDTAVALNDTFKDLKTRGMRYDALSEKYNLTDENMTDEEFTFMTEYAAIAMMLEQIPYGNGTLKSYLNELVWNHWSHRAFYPIVAALSEGQRALANLGMFTTILQYSSSTKPIDELYQILEENEKDFTDKDGNIKPFDVYMGVDRSIFDGNFAFTNEAERQQALTGKDWTSAYYLSEEATNYIPIPAIRSLATVGTAVAVSPFILKAVLKGALLHARSISYECLFATTKECYGLIAFLSGKKATATGTVATLNGTKLLVCAGAGLLIAAAGVAGISVWYGYYNPDYTPIPDTMIDVRATDLGDKYIKYTAAKVYDDEKGRNADFNAYQGKEWIALYYTKDANAGKCLTPNFVYKDNDSSVARRHQGISMFGESAAFNLNNHVYSKNAPGVYVTMRYSTTKKAAAIVPDVVGSIFSGGTLYALTAVGGIGAGIGATLLIQKAKKKKEETPEALEEN